MRYSFSSPFTGKTLLKQWYFVVLLGVISIACQPTNQSPAPLGERQALEKLAGVYDRLSQRLPISPSGLTPQGKLKFVHDVFKKAGYDYNATLNALAQTPSQTVNSYHKDMTELLFMPHRGLSRQDMETLYSKEELENIDRVNAILSETTGHPAN
jgi:hypothetical protein